MSVFQKTFFSGSGVEAILAFVIGATLLIQQQYDYSNQALSYPLLTLSVLSNPPREEYIQA